MLKYAQKEMATPGLGPMSNYRRTPAFKTHIVFIFNASFTRGSVLNDPGSIAYRPRCQWRRHIPQNRAVAAGILAHNETRSQVVGCLTCAGLFLHLIIVTLDLPQ